MKWAYLHPTSPCVHLSSTLKIKFHYMHCVLNIKKNSNLSVTIKVKENWSTLMGPL